MFQSYETASPELEYPQNFENTDMNFDERAVCSDNLQAQNYTSQQLNDLNQMYEQNYNYLRMMFNQPPVQRAIKGIIHLANHIRKDDENNNVRLFLRVPIGHFVYFADN